MNYLAHLRLAPDDPMLRLGNLLGDFMRGVDMASLPPPLQRGVAQHRAIDRFTDRHPLFRQSRARLPAPFRRFGGVLVDVYYDHFLARHWDRFGDGGPLGEFTQRAYRELGALAQWLPPRLAQAAPRMREGDWLLGYRELHAIDDVLARMARRLRHDNPLAQGGEPLRSCYGELQSDFEAFFPALLEHVQTVVHALPD